MKVLVVEDSPVQRKYLSSLLQKLGYEVEEAEDGEQAWTMLEDGDIRAVISDWMMPGLNGPELTKRIRAQRTNDYTYIIMLSALDSKGKVIEGLESGADDYITKPFERAELAARMKIGERILELERRLKDMALRDALTGALNRHAFVPRAEAELARADRNGTGTGFLMIDIDDFKMINDRFGHSAGDETLKAISGLICSSFRSYDSVCRWGGEEFLVLLPEPDSSILEDLAERLRSAVEKKGPYITEKGECMVTVSIGACSRAPRSGDLPACIELADAAMYEAKGRGKNAVVIRKLEPAGGKEGRGIAGKS